MHQAARPPTRIGPYELLEHLGTGAMGDVYRAREDGEDRPIALKVLHPHLLQRRNFFRRFQREALAGSAVQHPNVVRTLDAGFHVVDGVTWCVLAMEYVEGRTLRSLLEELGALPQPLWLEIAKRIAAGLVAIHAAGIVHRDLKPENVLITPDHEVKIMDLGVAQLVDGDRSLTGEGQFIGSLPYAAPEQLRGAPVGPATDLYALGVILRELATGENFFFHENPTAVLHAHLSEEPPNLGDDVAQAAPWPAGVIQTLLAKAPSERFRSAGDLNDVLREGSHSRWWKAQQHALRPVCVHMPRIPVSEPTRLHGRVREQTLLRHAWERARGGEGSTLLLVGEAGVGKSRLLSELVQSLGAEECRVLYGAWSPSGESDALGRSLHEVLRASDVAASLQAFLPGQARLAEVLAARLRSGAASGTDLLPRDVLAAAFAAVMHGLAAARPLVWIIEDLHLATREERHLALSLARAVRDRRVLLVLTTRRELDKSGMAEFTRLETTTRIDLGPIEVRALEAVVRERIGDPVASERWAARVAKHADGNPWIALETARVMEARRWFRPDPGASPQPVDAWQELPIPGSVRHLVLARLGPLGRRARELLDVAAVIGQEFDPRLLASVWEQEFLLVLRELAAIERDTGLVVSGSDRMRFDHHHVHEVLYDELPRRLRQEYHTLIGDRMAESESGHGDAGRAVHHLLRGYDPVRAAPLLESAVEAARSTWRYDSWMDLRRRSLAVPGMLEGRERLEALLDFARALHLAGRLEEEQSVAREALSLAMTQADARGEVDARTSLARHLAARGQLEQALGEMDRRDARVAELNDPALSIQFMSQRSALLAHHGRLKEAERLARYALELALPRKDGQVITGARTALASALSYMGRRDEALEQYEEALAEYERAGRVTEIPLALSNIGRTHLSHGRITEARACLVRAMEMDHEFGFRIREANTLNTLAITYLAEGRFEGARPLFERYLALSREMGTRGAEGTAIGNLGEVARHTGRFGEAESAYRRWRAIGREVSNRSAELDAQGYLGWVLTVQGRLDEAWTEATAGLALARDLGNRVEEGLAFHSLARIRDRRGEHGEAEGLYRDAVRIRRQHSRVQLGESLVSLGRHLMERGRDGEARALFEEAMEMESAKEATVLASLYRALLEGDLPSAALEAYEGNEYCITFERKIVARYDLWRRTHDEAHREEGLRRLDFALAGVAEDHRGSMIHNVPVHRGLRAGTERGVQGGEVGAGS